MGQSIVLYFSNTGHTQAIAERIAATTGSELVGIQAKVPYTPADLDWEDQTSRSYQEMHAGKIRPAIEPIDSEKIASATTVFLGFPLWWSAVPRPIDTLLDNVDLTGKDVHPFCTSGSTPIAEAIVKLREHYPDIRWHTGRRFASSLTRDEIQDWAIEE
ncbi:flavodoxin [Levilactobacillus lindianensis]|uniref:flavodoxin n=1 Tax=Levilactobacillus lindianensis TaxID=2486018 RepID=UPI000F7387EB|nr:flavodoxin [Levilactobacillus lindianensis]